MGTKKDSELTRKKLIETAGELFAQKGFSAVTIREIAAASGTNLSAINYHFRDKESLYHDVLLEACDIASFSPEEQQQWLELDPAEALHKLTHETLKEYLSEDTSQWQTLLILQESKRQGPVFQKIMKEYLKPQTDFFAKLIASALKKNERDIEVQFKVVVLVGLLEIFGFYSHVVKAATPELFDRMKEGTMLSEKLASLILSQPKSATDDEQDPKKDSIDIESHSTK